ncbi:MAG: hypothetical protein JWN44_880 [Myxococcales bacterium]|nr:hypothetical protein [Myxococcales bacterium]
MSRALALAVVLLTAAHAFAQRVSDDREKRWAATRTTTPPKIDGKLDDPAWMAVRADARFTQNFPNEGQEPSQRTELRVLFDDTALYIAVRAFDDNPGGIVERLTRRDRDTDADKVQVEISSKNDRITAYHFDVNVSGVLVDGVRFNDVEYSSDWDGLWLGATSRDAGGWTAELMIPLKTLRYEGHRTEFGFQVRRTIQRTGEVDEWAHTPRSVRGECSYYGVLDGLKGLRAARLFQIVPYLGGGIYLRYNQDPPALDGTRLYGNIGGDIKLGLTPALTLDVTINPDFGQVEADQVVLNLSTFEVFFPEKRPFFLEGVDVFATPIQLFYSRRIGRPPSGPADYVPTEPLPQGRIWAAAKLTGVIAPRLTIGVLDAITDAPPVTVSRDGSLAHQTIMRTDPLTNYAVLRLKRDIFAHSYVGFMGTAVTRFEQPYAVAPADGDSCPSDPVTSRLFRPTSRGYCAHDAYTGGIDGYVTNTDNSWGLRAHLTGAVIGGGPERQLADGVVLRSGDGGVGMHAEGGKLSGNFVTSVLYRGFSPKYDINDAGYQQRANLHFAHNEVGYRWLKPFSIFLEANTFAGINFRSSWNGNAIYQKQAWSNVWMRFRNFWTMYFELDYDLDHDDNRETRDGAITERTGGWSTCLFGTSDRRKRFFADGGACMTRVQRGQSFDAQWTLKIRPIPAVELDVIPHASWTFGDPRWFDTEDHGDGSRTYFFADLESRNFDVTFRGTYTFLPTLTLQAYAQIFIDGGHYGDVSTVTASGPRPRLTLPSFRQAAMPNGIAPDFRDGTVNVNVVLRYEFLPGSTILFVYTHAQDQTLYDPNEGIGRPSFSRFGGGPGTDLLLVKLSLLLM